MKIKNKKRKSRLQQQLLMYDFASLSGERLESVLREIERTLLKEARKMIGYENSVSLYDLFIKVYGLPPECIEFYKRICLFEVIKKCMRRLRSDMQAYFIFNRNNAFILKNENEANLYKKFLQNDIIALKRAQRNADEWVEKKMWRNL